MLKKPYSADLQGSSRTSFLRLLYGKEFKANRIRRTDIGQTEDEAHNKNTSTTLTPQAQTQSFSGCPADISLKTNICFSTKEEKERKQSEIIKIRRISMHDEVPASMWRSLVKNKRCFLSKIKLFLPISFVFLRYSILWWNESLICT